MRSGNQTYPFNELENKLKGDLSLDNTSKTVYSTDASSYYEEPLGVAIPRDVDDVSAIIQFANTHKLSLIPRAAGTSLAGQVVGSGLVVDVGRYMNKVLDLNVDEKWVKVQPGVVLDELNQFLEPHGLFFGPETSTSNRCMIGGMVGNNSCGAHSLIYGSTRDHTLELKGFLSNGDVVSFKALKEWEFESKCKQKDFEGEIYSSLQNILTNKRNRDEIQKEFPHPDIKRRNTGYALDYLVEDYPFNDDDDAEFNLCKLLAGSEGTLMFTTEIKLNLIDLPPKEKGLLCVHLHSLEQALEANLIALKFAPGAVELMDKTIMDLTKGNALQNKNRFFVQGDPSALLLVEFARETKQEIEVLANSLTLELQKQGYGYAFPLLFGTDIKKVWNLRKAGLGVLANMPGDERPVPVIEDTAVRPEDLPSFIANIKAMLKKHGKECVYYAHIGTGELHLRPVLNMKKAEDVELFHTIASETAVLVKTYRGSLSGEHGDGRLRGQFIPLMVGDHINNLFGEVKNIFDPNNIFNPHKITDTPPMNTSLRYKPMDKSIDDEVVFDWSSTKGIARAAEKCSGSGDCRKSHLIGGTMCPSYMGSRNEKLSTRARANVLREFFANKITANKLEVDEVKSVLDLCLSCKACKNECPSNVDMTKLKAEFLNYYHKQYGVPMRSKLIARVSAFNKKSISYAYIYNKGIKWTWVKELAEYFIGFSSKRQLPSLPNQSLQQWGQQRESEVKGKKVLFFADEFTNYIDSDIGIIAVLLLERLGYQVIVVPMESGRTYLSKGLVSDAKVIAKKNILMLSDKIDADISIVGIEPSAILTLRDEYLELVPAELKSKAEQIAKCAFTIEEFLVDESNKGFICEDSFTDEEKQLRFHGHCYQKALSDTLLTKAALEIPKNYKAHEIQSGCCGMAGSFGFEKEHYDLSMKIGELILFPEVRKHKDDSLIIAAGTSCRHQIKDGTGVQAHHPVQVLYEALR